ncbi:MAG: hypothetical protein AAF939_17320 [Planctomycetota bacterium]
MKKAIGFVLAVAICLGGNSFANAQEETKVDTQQSVSDLAESAKTPTEDVPPSADTPATPIAATTVPASDCIGCSGSVVPAMGQVVGQVNTMTPVSGCVGCTGCGSVSPCGTAVVPVTTGCGQPACGGCGTVMPVSYQQPIPTPAMPVSVVTSQDVMPAVVTPAPVVTTPATPVVATSSCCGGTVTTPAPVVVDSGCNTCGVPTAVTACDPCNSSRRVFGGRLLRRR